MNRVLVIIFLVLLASCETNERPQGVLTQAQLSEFLVDVYLAEARVDAIPEFKDSTIKYFMPMEEKLLKRRGLSDSVLRVTYSYYAAHPKELEQVYDAVIDTLALRERRLGQAPVAFPKKGIPLKKSFIKKK